MFANKEQKWKDEIANIEINYKKLPMNVMNVILKENYIIWFSALDKINKNRAKENKPTVVLKNIKAEKINRAVNKCFFFLHKSTQ